MSPENTCNRPSLWPLTELLLLIAAMWAFIFYDPLRIGLRLVEFLKSHYDIFVKEPRLMHYAYAHIGSIIAKSLAVILIVVLSAFRRIDPEEGLGIRPPGSGAWVRYIPVFVFISILARFYYLDNPLVPNLPVRLVFPEAMLAGNVIIILSVIFIAPITEEVIFRGYMYGVFRKYIGSYGSIVFTSILFAAAHFRQLNYSLADACMILAFGAIFGIVRYSTGSTLAAIAFHSLYNIVYTAAGMFNYMILGY